MEKAASADEGPATAATLEKVPAECNKLAKEPATRVMGCHTRPTSLSVLAAGAQRRATRTSRSFRVRVFHNSKGSFVENSATKSPDARWSFTSLSSAASMARIDADWDSVEDSKQNNHTSPQTAGDHVIQRALTPNTTICCQYGNQRSPSSSSSPPSPKQKPPEPCAATPAIVSRTCTTAIARARAFHTS